MKFDAKSFPLEIPEIHHVAVVVEDLDKGMAQYSQLLGLEPWEIFRFEPPRLTNQTYRGQESDHSMRLALAEMGEINIELIEPLQGENTYTEHLQEHGEGFHHILPIFDDPHDVVEMLRDEGISMIQSGTFVEDVMYWYFDTRDVLNGVILEVSANADQMPDEPDAVYPPK